MIKGHVIFKTGITGPNSLILKPMQLVRADYPEVSLISVETPPDESALQVTVHFEEIPSDEAASTLGHVRPGATPQATREAMRLRVDRLAEHAKTAIELHG